MLNATGGYFELELGANRTEYHKDAECLNTGRNCLEYIVCAKSPKRIFVPYYTCDVILDVLRRHPIQIVHYHIDKNFEPEMQYELKDGDMFMYINYFGMMTKVVAGLAWTYNNRLIVDNSQAFYSRPIKSVDTFYSARKFFGVADGAYLYTSNKLDIELEDSVSYSRMMHLLKRIDISAEAGYEDFCANEALLKSEKLKRMSKLTERILQSIDYERIKEKRIENFTFIDSLLSESNGFHFVRAEDEVPMVYPYLCSEKPDRKKLAQIRLYTPQYWSSLLESDATNDFERNVAENTVFCPIDQRYDEPQLLYVASQVRNR
jgi:hypothetical protein